MMDIPQQMRAMAIDQYGGPEVLTLHTLPVPEVGANEVLIRVEVAGVGVWDPYEREGQLIVGETYFPRILGGDGAGVVVAVGSDVTEYRMGDRVYGFGFQSPKGGFYAEYIVLSTNLIMRIPGRLSSEEAGAMPIDAITGLCGFEKLQLKEGQMLLIWGASGGIGHLAVQMAKSMGVKVFGVASGANGVEFVHKLGADAVVDGHGDGVVEQAKAFAPEGFDAALILAGGDKAQAVLETVRSGGHVAFPHGVQPEPQAPSGVEVHDFDGYPTPELFKKLNFLIEEGPFEVAIARTYPLEDAVKAQEDLKGHLLGKVILKM